MAQISQASLAELMRVCSRLGLRTQMFSSDPVLVSETEIRRFLFSRNFENRVLDLFETYRWNFDVILPDIKDGSFGVSRNGNWRTRAEQSSQNAVSAEGMLRALSSAFLVKSVSLNHGPYGSVVDLQGLIKSLRQDGFDFAHGELIDADREIVDIPAEATAIEKAIEAANHDDKAVLRHHLGEATRYFTSGDFGPAAAEWRHFYEGAFRGAWRYTRGRNAKFSGRIEKPPFADVLRWLAESHFVSQDEASAYGAAWGFLSVGNHPGIKPQAIAHLCRTLAMTLGHACLIKLAVWDGVSFK